MMVQWNLGNSKEYPISIQIYENYTNKYLKAPTAPFALKIKILKKLKV